MRNFSWNHPAVKHAARTPPAARRGCEKMREAKPHSVFDCLGMTK
jgi:hypothetical protein